MSDPSIKHPCLACARHGRVSFIPRGSGCGACSTIFLNALRDFLGLKPLAEESARKAIRRRPEMRAKEMA